MIHRCGVPAAAILFRDVGAACNQAWKRQIRYASSKLIEFF